MCLMEAAGEVLGEIRGDFQILAYSSYARLQPLGNSRVFKKVFTQHLRAGSFCKG